MALQQNRLPTPEKPLYADAVASACLEAEPPRLQQLQAQGQASQRKKKKREKRSESSASESSGRGSSKWALDCEAS